MANRWGKVKMCCRCSQPGHHSHECKQPIYPTPPPKPEPPKEPEKEDDEDRHPYNLGYF